MANNYLQFSEVIPQLTTQEADWLRGQLEVVCVFGEHEHPEDKLPVGMERDEADWIGCRAYRDMPGYDPEWGEDAGFEFEFFDDERDTVDRVAHLVHKFLKAHRPDESWSLTWAVSCSKPRVGELLNGGTRNSVRQGHCVLAVPFLGNFNFRFVFLILKLALRPPMANNPERQKV